ncbi:MAG: hypothetical protein V1746_03705 [bacterium]
MITRLSNSIKHEYDRKLSDIEHEHDRQLEEFRFEMKKQEQAARVAKLLAMRYYSDFFRPDEKFFELAWELTLWLPADIVCELSNCLCRPTSEDPRELLISIREKLQGKKDDLRAEQIIQLGKSDILPGLDSGLKCS